MLEAIDELPEDERESFDLVRIQGMTHTEASQILGNTPDREAEIESRIPPFGQAVR